MNKRKKDEVNLYIVDSDITFQNKIINTLKNNSNCRINLYNSTKDFFYISTLQTMPRAMSSK